MAFSFLFNGVELNKWLRVTDVQRNIGQNRESNMTVVGRSDGALFRYAQAKAGTIIVEALMIGNLPTMRRELAEVLTTHEPARLVFGDEPDRYYSAIVEGQTTLAEKLRHGAVELTFTVPDALAHAVNVKTFSQVADGSVTINNEGTGPAYPIIHCVMHGDNGIVAMANDSGGALQFGDAEAVDEVSHIRSDKVLSLDYRNKPTSGVEYNYGVIEQTGMTGGAKNVMTGSINWEYSDEAAAPVFADDDVDAWNGPSMTGTIKPNYAGTNVGDFQFWNRLGTYPTAKGRFRCMFTLQSGDAPVVTMYIRSSVTNKDDLQMDCIVNGKYQKTFSLNRKKFTKGWQECQINRKGDTLSFLFGQITSYVTGSDGTTKDSATQPVSVNLDGIGDVVIDGWTMWFARYQKASVPTLWWANTLFRWVNETEWDDVPNLYSDGDELVIDTKQRKAFLNGVDTGWYVPGNGWDDFIVNKPQMVIKPMQSEWAEPMTVTVELEEAFV